MEVSFITRINILSPPILNTIGTNIGNNEFAPGEDEIDGILTTEGGSTSNH